MLKILTPPSEIRYPGICSPLKGILFSHQKANYLLNISTSPR